MSKNWCDGERVKKLRIWRWSKQGSSQSCSKRLKYYFYVRQWLVGPVLNDHIVVDDTFFFEGHRRRYCFVPWLACILMMRCCTIWSRRSRFPTSNHWTGTVMFKGRHSKWEIFPFATCSEPHNLFCHPNLFQQYIFLFCPHHLVNMISCMNNNIKKKQFSTKIKKKVKIYIV